MLNSCAGESVFVRVVELTNILGLVNDFSAYWREDSALVMLESGMILRVTEDALELFDGLSSWNSVKLFYVVNSSGQILGYDFDLEAVISDMPTMSENVDPLDLPLQLVEFK